MAAWHINTLVRTQHAIVQDLSYNGRAINANNQHIQCPIVKQNMVTFLNISSKILIRQINNVMGRVHFRTPKQLHNITRLIFNRGFTSRSTHLWPFGINKYSNMVAYFSHVPYYIIYTVFRCMGRIHPNNINTCIKQLTNKIHVASTVTH